MINLNTYIKESLFDSNLTSSDPFKYHPKTKDELKECIIKELKIQGYHADLNCIDVSKITDMSNLFEKLDAEGHYVSNIDISLWNVKNVKNMHGMFAGCYSFNSDLSKWDVSNVEDMFSMFASCVDFNSNIADWDVRKVKNMGFMFEECKSFDCDLSKWNTRKVKNMAGMFRNCFSLKKIPSWAQV